MAMMPYINHMKMTLHIDEDILKAVMDSHGITSKTKAVDFALRDAARRSELKRLASEGLGLNAMELREVFDPASDLRVPVAPIERVTYGRKSAARR